jgi:hypothetical protein
MEDVVDLATCEPPPLRYTVDDIVKSGQRAQKRRRIGWLGSGVTAVVAVGAAAAVTVPSLAGGAPLAAATTSAAGASGPATIAAAPDFPAAAPFTFTFDGYRVGKLRVGRPIDVSTAYQLAPVYADDLTTNDKAFDPNHPAPQQAGELYAYLTVYRPGAYDPARLAGARQVTVAGRPGLEASEPGPDGSSVVRTLAWQYGTNAWAVISSNSTEADNPSAADLRKLAAGLRPATPVPARVPVTMSYVPSGYRLDEAAAHAMTGLNGIAAARNGDYAGLLFSKPGLPTTGLTEPYGGVEGNDPPGSFLVFVVPAANSNQHASSGISCGDGFCNRWAENGKVNIQVENRAGGLSDSEMTKILNGITLGNVHDDGTWTPVSAVVR